MPTRPDMIETLKCTECGTTDDRDEVRETTHAWTAWGRNCGDFNWQRQEMKFILCSDCEADQWRTCDKCGDLIEADYLFCGYGPESRDFVDPVCPGCAPEVGWEVDVPICAPPWSANPSPESR